MTGQVQFPDNREFQYFFTQKGTGCECLKLKRLHSEPYDKKAVHQMIRIDSSAINRNIFHLTASNINSDLLLWYGWYCNMQEYQYYSIRQVQSISVNFQSQRWLDRYDQSTRFLHRWWRKSWLLECVVKLLLYLVDMSCKSISLFYLPWIIKRQDRKLDDVAKTTEFS